MKRWIARKRKQCRERNIETDMLQQLLKPDVQEALTAWPRTSFSTRNERSARPSVRLGETGWRSDRVLVQDTLGGLVMVKPLEEKAKHYASAAIEARNRAEQEKRSIGLFGMLRLLERFGEA